MPSEPACGSPFTLTDFTGVVARVYGGDGNVVRTLQAGEMVAGRKSLQWDRRNDAVQHGDAEQYRFTGLNPSSAYAVRAEYVAGDGVVRQQDMSAGGIRIYVAIPLPAHATGDMVISGNRRLSHGLY